MRHRYDRDHPTGTYRTGWADHPDLRVSDAERNDVAERLSRHFADGRLDQSEFGSRLDQATGAKTRRDLDGLFDDLPRLADEPSPPRTRRRRLLPLLLVVILVAAVADAALSQVHATGVWVVVVGLLIWYRLGRRHAPSDPR
ncbi:MAG TPA: DUF1707 domain-containing protein [Acidimicrobiales bacterium]